MTDQRLHDLLHESVADATMPDLADAAWRSSVRGRRRRTAVVLAGATAAVVAVAGTVALTDHAPDRRTPSGPTTSSPNASPDARVQGIPVWWAPTVAQEPGLRAYPDSPLPPEVDLSTDAPALASHPLDRALAAYAVVSDTGVERVLVVGPGSDYRTVDISRVHPMRDPEGHLRVAVGTSMLSPSGQYLMFPQSTGVLLLRLGTGRWRTVHTLPGASTWSATWLADRTFTVPQASESRSSTMYSIDRGPEGTSDLGGYGLPPLPEPRAFQPYGRVQAGRSDVAQSFYPAARIPTPTGPPAQSDWIAVAGQHSSLLVLPSDQARQKACCQVDGWIGPNTVLYDSSSSSGTMVLAWRVQSTQFWQVTRLTGITPGQEYVVSSYARLTGPR